MIDIMEQAKAFSRVENRIRIRFVEHNPESKTYEVCAEKDGMPLRDWKVETEIMFAQIFDYIVNKAIDEIGEGVGPIVANLWIELDKLGSKFQVELESK